MPLRPGAAPASRRRYGTHTTASTSTLGAVSNVIVACRGRRPVSPVRIDDADSARLRQPGIGRAAGLGSGS